MVKKRKVFGFSFFIVLLSVLITRSVMVYGEKNRVYDDAKLYTQQDIVELEGEAAKLSASHNMDIIIVTTLDAGEKTSREYADDFYDIKNFGVGNNQSGILFLIDMDNGEVYISTAGEGIRYLTDQRIESILEKVLDSGLGEGAYFASTMSFLSETKKYLEQGIPVNQYSQDESVKTENSLTPKEGIASILSGLFASTVFFFRNKTKYKMEHPVKPQTFRRNSLIDLKVKEEKLLDTATVHKPIAHLNPLEEGEKSTTHTSSSGKTHGGAGTKFK